MLLSEFSMTNSNVAIPSDQYKRAVLRVPPSRFSVEFLPFPKNNGAYHHGMHIAPITSDRDSVSTRGHIEYDIWRRWEDCLYLQETIETEYKTAAREKKTRLAQGKGVKAFNGMYKQDMASSWESLPPGPDPNSVNPDVHAYLPRLSKKGTIFKASQALIESRQKEFQTLVETLFSDDMPALIKEIRASNHVTDFFGLWRRDYDLLESQHPPEKGSRHSLTQSVFASYFADSSPSLYSRKSEVPSILSSPAKSKKRSSNRSSRDRPRSSGSSGSEITEISRYPQSTNSGNSSRRLSGGIGETSVSNEASKPRRRPLSTDSSDSSTTTHSDASSDTGSSASSAPAVIQEEEPLDFGHNPQKVTERPSSILEVLPEEREMLAKAPEKFFGSPRHDEKPAGDRRANRSWQVLGTPTADRTTFEEDSVKGPASHRESWQSTATTRAAANEIVDEIGFTLPHPIREQKFRASIASISTFMTTNSADAVMRSEFEDSSPIEDDDDDEAIRNLTRLSTSVSLSDYEIYSEADDESIIDTRPTPTATPATTKTPERPETPTGRYLAAPSTPIRSSPGICNPPPSPTASTTSAALSISTNGTPMSSSSGSPGTLSIKASHNTSIIMLRVPREILFSDLRQRLYNKFVGQEGVPLSQDFSVAFMIPHTPLPVKGQRVRADSATQKDKMELHFIDCEDDWESILSTVDATKVNLRILDCPRS